MQIEKARYRNFLRISLSFDLLRSPLYAVGVFSEVLPSA